MSRFFQRYTLLFLGIILLGCSQQPRELATAESLIETAPDSALHILQSLSSYKYNSGANRALYGLLMIQALDRKHLPLNPNSLLDYSIEYYQNHTDGDRLATSLLFKGRAYKYAAQYDKAMNLYLKSLDEANTTNALLLGRIYLDMGDINNIQGDYTLAREKYRKAYTYFMEAKFQPQAFYSRLNIGRTYHEAKDYKTAQQFYKHIINDAKDSVQLGALFQEIGLNFYDSKQLDSALIYYKKVISYPYIGTNRSIRYSYLANLYFDIEQYDSAFIYANNSFKYEIGFRTQRDCYRIMANCEFVKKNTVKVTTYMNKYVALGDSLRKVEAQIKGSYMETTHKATKEAARSKNIAGYLGVTVLLLMIAGYLVSKRYRKEKKQMHDTHTEETGSRHKRIIQDKRFAIQKKIKERKDEILNEKKNASMQEREKQIRKIYDDLLHIDDTEFFFREMNIVLNNLVTKLQNRFIDINTKELIWCCLFLLKIPTQDMLILLDYKTDNSLKTLKNRLPKKFNLENATLLGDFLIGILTED